MITVWGRRSSINVQKVLWALAETGVEFERITVGGSFKGNDTPEFKKLNPMGLIPVMRDGNIVFFESNAILRYIARRYGKATLQPRWHRAHALAEQWVEWTTTTLAVPVGTIFWNRVRIPAGQANEAAVKEAERTAAGYFRLANRILGRKPFVAGGKFSYGDIPPGALYWRYQNLQVDRPSLPNLDRWFGELKERSAYRQWIMVPVGRNLDEWTVNEQALK
jgi:glutathione S-transferase